jgi:hypothetical protein
MPQARCSAVPGQTHCPVGGGSHTVKGRRAPVMLTDERLRLGDSFRLFVGAQPAHNTNWQYSDFRGGTLALVYDGAGTTIGLDSLRVSPIQWRLSSTTAQVFAPQLNLTLL